MYSLCSLIYLLLLYYITIVNPFIACHLFTKLTIFTLKPNPLIHINIMCTWIGRLGTKGLPNGFTPHMCFHMLTSLFLQLRII